ncbi:BTAD domain-containing putative transcriptional regulator [Mycobacterium sp. NPDC051804]|uniref:BTAD domain-containing putative transcriptional regulator n=1 Tax=Mycobacterium sp. NPDC051804 TaxID=3364295 RepID=UPI0037A8DAAC
MELGVLGPLQVRQYGLPVSIPGAKPRAILTMLGLHGGSIVSAETLVELLWGDDPPRTAAKALPTHISTLRRTLGDGFVLTAGTGWALGAADVDATRYKSAAKLGRDALAAGDASQAVTRFDEALALWRDTPELPGGLRGVSERTRWIEDHAALVEDRADALLATGRAAEIIGELEAAISEAPLRERRWGQLMLALYRAGRQGEALGAYQRARSLLVEELGVDPGPDLRRLEAAIVAQDAELEVTVPQQLQTATRTVTFLLTDIEGSTAAWETDADAMAVALARHDELVEQVVTSRGGRLIKTRGEGDATFSVFDRASGAATSAIELQEAMRHEPWALREPMRIRVALHTGEVELRDGDYFGRAVNRAARLRSLAVGGQILCSGATAELVIDTLPDDVVLADLGTRQLKNLARPEHVFELRLETAADAGAPNADASIEQPELPAVLAGTGPFVGRSRELEGLLSAWQTALATGTHAVLIAGEPGVGKTRLAGEWARQAHELGAVVLYGRCDEDLGAPYQPFAEALRTLVPCLGSDRLRGLRGVKALFPLIPGLADDLPDLVAPTHADADAERYALFDAVAALLGIVCASAPVVVILDDLHWAAKPTLLLLRHLLRFGEHAPVQIVGTYRSTDLDRAHPLAAMLADLHRDGSADRLALSGLDQDDITAYVNKAGYDDDELARALATVTGGNPFFLIEALRHVDESGGRWDPRTLPQGVREAVSRRLSRLTEETNTALSAAAVVGSRFSLDLVERVTGDDLIDAFDEASKAGIVIEEPGGRYRFNHALVRQSLLAELASVRRMRLHQRIATTLEAEPGADEELLAELAYHYFECAWAGNAVKAVEYCRRAADQAMARLAYEGAADLYDKALHALDELDDELPNRDDQQAELLIARCEALLAAGDVVSAAKAVSQLQAAARDSARLTAWGACFDGQLSMLTDPERLDDIEVAVSAAAEKLAELDDAAGEAKAHTVRATCLARLGRIGDAETALDQALTAARHAREHRRVNNVLANAPLAALWGPNPVPRAGGRCLDVVRLLRITTGSPVVEATSTRCQGVLDAFRGRAAAGRRLIDSARRTLTELGMRHALLEVEQFAGIVELVADDPAAAEPHLRRACDGFRRMGLDADTAETAALLARACLALDRVDEAGELCTESERLAGHALKASIAWRTVRAQLMARNGDHGEAKRMAEEAVDIAGGTDLLVDHGDACVTLATVLSAGGDVAGARAAADKAVALYEAKGAAALVDKARDILGRPTLPGVPPESEAPQLELDNECVRVADRAMDLINREALDEAEQLWAPDLQIESRRKIVRFTSADLPPNEWYARRALQVGGVRVSGVVIAIRGERLALARTAIATTDASPGAAIDEFLRVFGLDEEGRIALEVWFDVDDMDAAVAELDARYAQLEAEHPPKALQNAASRAEERLNLLFADRRWDEIAVLLADDLQAEERRRGLRRESGDGVKRMIDEVRVIADLGVKTITSDPVAIRGEHLVLSRVRFAGRDVRPDAYRTDVFRLTEIGDDGRVVSFMTLDIDDLDPAVAELDARYLAGEAAPHADNWQAVMDALGELNRHERGAILMGLTFENHRRASFASEDYGRAVEDLWALAPDAHYRVPVVYELDAEGVVFGLVVVGTDTHGTEVQWAGNISWLFEQSRAEMYEAEDLDAALARFTELHALRPRLENSASRAVERYLGNFGTRNWDAIAQTLAEEVVTDDRRRTVNAGVRHGREAPIADMQAGAEVGGEKLTATVIATRGEHLALCRVCSFNRGAPDEIGAELVGIAELNDDNQLAAFVMFDLGDIDAAFEELDARYETGEAAACAQTWSVIKEAYAAINRREIVATTPDWMSHDYRRAIAFEPGELPSWIRASWGDMAPDFTIRIEAVHRLTEVGAVVTHTGRGTSQEGFGAEWRIVSLVTVEGSLINRGELYDEEDLDTALAKLGKLSQAAHGLENSASRAVERYLAHFTTRNWDAMAGELAEDVVAQDHRRFVGAGTRLGSDLQIADMRASAEVGAEKMTSAVIATRGERIALSRVRAYNRDFSSDEFGAEMLGVVELGTDDRIAAIVVFDVDDIDAAFAELDVRYLAGEAAPYAQTWSLVSKAYTALDRHELPATTPDWVNVDHRQISTIESGALTASIRASWDLFAYVRWRIENVHRLSQLGGVFSQVAQVTSQEGFEAEAREIAVLTFDGDMIERCEIFDEADLETALATFDELTQTTHQLENAASRLAGKYLAHFAPRDWNAMGEILADDFSADDRRHVVNAGVRSGRDAEIANLKAIAEIGCVSVTPTPIATRGDRLALVRDCFTIPDSPEALQLEVIDVIEINADNRILAYVTFDAGDLDAALAELDARYVAGEAAAHADAWSTIARAYAAINRREIQANTESVVNIDHRRVASFAPGEGSAYFHASWELAAHLHVYIEVVHRLNDLGAVFSYVAKGFSQDDFEADWRAIDLITVEGDLINRSELFDESDRDIALAKFDELSQPAHELNNSASRAVGRYLAYFTTRDWGAMAGEVAEGVVTEDRRRVIGAGIRRGRDLHIADMRAAAGVGGERTTAEVIATRGECLVLSRIRTYNRGMSSDEFGAEMLGIAELDADGQIALLLATDGDDFDAALQELEVRYLAGDGAAHARVWSVIARGYAGLNRRELPPHTADLVSIDHRRGASAFAPGNLTAYIGAIFELANIATYVEAVHRLTDQGVLVTHVGSAASPEGFDAEWRMIVLVTVEGDLINRAEFFDEDDLEAALARFDELEQPPRLENDASRAYNRFTTFLTARDWDAMREMIAADIWNDDRRRVVNTGIISGREAQIANVRAILDVATTDEGDDVAELRVESTVIAIRGERLALIRSRVGSGQQAVVWRVEMLNVVELNAEHRIAAGITFDIDDLDAAFAELNARYGTGEGVAGAQTWSLVGRAIATLNRRELPGCTTDWVNVDHRKAVAFAPGDMTANIRAAWNQNSDFYIYIESVHRLTNLGAVFTRSVNATSREGFDAEWRVVELLTFRDDLVSRLEIFDEADIGSALASFDELSRSVSQVENTASRVYAHFRGAFSAHDWDTLREIMTDDIILDDRRSVVNAGVRQGRDTQINDLRAIVSVGGEGVNVCWTIVAIRGERLALVRNRWSIGDEPEAFHNDALEIVEIDADERAVAAVQFDSDDLEAAIAELDARYLAGEAARYADVWLVVAETYAALNRRKLPATTPDWVNVDHRRGFGFAPGDLSAYTHASWDLSPDLTVYIEAVHRIASFGAVVTHTAHGTTSEGFAAEWRGINVLTIEGELINRWEVFDESDIEAALSRFDELGRRTSQLENTASRTYDRFNASLTARDWDAMAEMIADDDVNIDRRRVVNTGVLRGREAQIENLRVIVDVGATNHESTVVAIRGDRLVLTRTSWSGSSRPGAFGIELLAVIEIDDNDRIAAGITFDLDDIDAAFNELETRYLAGEAAADASAWSLVTSTYATLNRHEFPATTPDWVNLDHRRVTGFAPGEMIPWIRAAWEVAPDLGFHVVAVHRLTNRGAVITHEAYGTSQDGFDAEWRTVLLLMFEAGAVSRCETFDEADLATALARFDELERSALRLENTASRTYDRFNTYLTVQDWDAMAEMIAEDVRHDDRRRVVNAGAIRGRDAQLANLRAIVDVGAVTHHESIVIAIRGERLALTRNRVSGSSEHAVAWNLELLTVVEVDSDHRIAAGITFDIDDIDAAFTELDSRYAAGEAATHTNAWSVVNGAYNAFNRRELFTTAPDWVSIDHRSGTTIAPGDLKEFVRASWDDMRDVRIYIEAVHRLSDIGVVATSTSHGTSREGFDAEWREIAVTTVHGNMVSRSELFDATDLDAALARFDELQTTAPGLENGASRASNRFAARFAARDLNAMAEMLTDDFSNVDRRRTVNTGTRRGRDAEIVNQRTLVELGFTRMTSIVFATRGEHLVLTRSRIAFDDERPDAFEGECLQVVEVDSNDQFVALVVFDIEDTDAAIAELDARYAAGEAPAHAHTWEVVANAIAAFNLGELPARTADFAFVDHRQFAIIEEGALDGYARAAWNQTPGLSLRVESVLCLNDVGSVFAISAHGTSQDGFDAEWRMIELLVVEGDLVTRIELFDEADIDTALARFSELSGSTKPPHPGC